MPNLLNISMDYELHYNTLIERGQARLLEGYVEVHHILPRCMGGGDESENLVRLTPEEHYVAHQLLVKMHPNNVKLLYAAVMMGNMRHTNKTYGWLKRRATIARICTKGLRGWYTNETEQVFVLHEDAPEGWRRGRTPGRKYANLTVRQIAKNCGFTKYLGKKCPEKHNGLRYVSTGNCVECITWPNA